MKLYDFNTIEEKIEFINARAVADKYCHDNDTVIDIKTLEGYAILYREYFSLHDKGCIFKLDDSVLEGILEDTILNYEDNTIDY